MRKIVFITLLFLSSHLNNLYSWDTTAAKYMPLQIGNVWVYYGESHHPYTSVSTWYCRHTVIGIIDTLGRRYYKTDVRVVPISGSESGAMSILQHIRIDSASMRVYNPGMNCNTNEKLLDSLRSRLNDTAYVCGTFSLSCCRDTSSFTVFGLSAPSKKFLNERWNDERKYAMGIGIVSTSWGEAGNSLAYILKGCVINGVLRGDTSMIVGINQISTEIPKSFSLYQNYPNPFNPSTKIKFDVPRVGAQYIEPLQLKVFNSLGQEVALLVNEQLQPGTYEVEWNAAEYPSGVYFYKLVVGENTNNWGFSETKKMVLVK